MTTTEIAIINESTVVADSEVDIVTKALQIQCDRDYTPIWHIDAHLTFYPKAAIASVPATSWQLLILDNSDQAGALGYHDVTATGQPIGKSFAGTDKQYGLNWSITTSHELLEQLTDPWINLVVFTQTTNSGGRIYSYEVCDACEDDKFGYDINGVEVSDFVTPAWFEDWRQPKSVQFDFKNHITAPFQLLSGGYISYFDVANGGGWKQSTAADVPEIRHRPVVGSRRERRKIAKSEWVKSV